MWIWEIFFFNILILIARNLTSFVFKIVSVDQSNLSLFTSEKKGFIIIIFKLKCEVNGISVFLYNFLTTRIVFGHISVYKIWGDNFKHSERSKYFKMVDCLSKIIVSYLPTFGVWQKAVLPNCVQDIITNTSDILRCLWDWGFKLLLLNIHIFIITNKFSHKNGVDLDAQYIVS